MLSRCVSLWWMIVIASHHGTEAAVNILFPNLRCLISFARLGYAPEKYDKYYKFFRNDSAMQVAQTGYYEGPNSIEEYIKYTDPNFTPFIIASKITLGRFRTMGYNRTSGLCEFFTSYKIRWSLDPNLTSVPEPFDMLGMVRMYYNLKERYITRINSYVTADFSRVMSNVAYNNDKVRSYVCSDVYFGPCKSILNITATPNQTVCETRMAALPNTEGSLNYVDGNVQACKSLHAVLAIHNPTTHCPHLSFEPMVDPNGNIKCQTSKGTLPSELFTQEELDSYKDYAKKFNIDPIKGHNSRF